MRNPDRNILAVETSRYFFISGVIEAIVALIFLLLIPKSPNNSWLLGLSWQRSLMAFALLGVIVTGWRLSHLAMQEAPSLIAANIKLQKRLDQFGKVIPILLLSFALVIAVGFLIHYNYLVENDLVSRAAVILRLSPFILFGVTRLSQLAGITFFMLRKSSNFPNNSKDKTTQVITRQKIVIVLSSIALFLVVLFIMVEVTYEFNPWKHDRNFLRRFVDIDGEKNLPAFFSTLILLISAFLLSVIAFIKRLRDEDYQKH